MAHWLRYSATNQKDAGLIPAGVIGIFHGHNPSDRTMALRSNQPLTEMSTWSISWGLMRPVPKADNLPPSCAVVTKSGSLNFLEPSGPLQACNGTDLLYRNEREREKRPTLNYEEKSSFRVLIHFINTFNPNAFSLLYLQLGTRQNLSILVYQSGSTRSCKYVMFHKLRTTIFFFARVSSSRHFWSRLLFLSSNKQLSTTVPNKHKNISSGTPCTRTVHVGDTEHRIIEHSFFRRPPRLATVICIGLIYLIRLHVQ